MHGGSRRSIEPGAGLRHDFVLRKYYPPAMTTARAEAYGRGHLERPIETLEKALQATSAERNSTPAGEAVVHWFKRDTRIRDNKALHLASEKAKEHSVPVVCVYLVSPQDFEAHLTAPVRVDFILRNLQVLKQDLAHLNIPLHVETVDKRAHVPSRLMELCQSWGAHHVFCNIEYEVDELRREAGLVTSCLGRGISFNAVADRCVVEPRELRSGSGTPPSVYSPWYRKWCAYLNQHPAELEPFPAPDKNPADTWDKYCGLFQSDIPQAPPSKRLSEQDRIKFRVMWPAGEHEAGDRLHKFIQERAGGYHNARNIPSANATSILSPHLAAGTLAGRTVVREARAAAPEKKLTHDRKQGYSMWIGELAFRDFYTYILCYWPYIWYVFGLCTRLDMAEQHS